MKVAVKSLDALDAKNVGEVELNEAIFGLKPRIDILQRIVVSQRATRRAGTHKVKSRGQIKGSTQKIMRQKGSGGARHGTRKVNLFRGGGVAHGPSPRDYTQKLPKKIRQLALRHALSARAQSASLFVLDQAQSEAPKTSSLRPKLTALGLSSALIVDSDIQKNFALSARNIPGIQVLSLMGLNVYDILRHDQLVLTQSALKGIGERFA